MSSGFVPSGNLSSRVFSQTANWFPNLAGLSLPRALTNAIEQAYLLIYSLRDAIQTSSTAATAAVGAAQLAYATGDYDLTHTPTVIPGCTLTLSAAGTYLVTGIFNVAILNDTGGGGGNDADFPMVAEAVLNGTVQPQTLTLQGPNQMQAGIAGQWLHTAAAAGEVISLNGYKIAGAGISHTTSGTLISALRVGA